MLTTIRTLYHDLAKLLALGHTHEYAASKTNTSLATVVLVAESPAFVGLVAHYKNAER